MQQLNVGEVEFVVERTYERGKRFLVPQHENYRLVYIVNGTANFHIVGDIHAVKEGNVLLLSPSCQYTMHVTGEKFNFITVSFTAECDIVKSNTMDTYYAQNLHSFFANMYTAYEMKEEGREFYIKSNIYLVLYNLSLEKISTSNKGIANAIFFIKNNYRKKICIADIALASGYSPSQMKKLFKEQTGRSPIEYLNSFRIERAKDLLKTEMYSISEVATCCGYENVYYFSNVFKRKMGVSPTKYKLLKM